jgi:hypothetical protein
MDIYFGPVVMQKTEVSILFAEAAIRQCQLVRRDPFIINNGSFIEVPASFLRFPAITFTLKIYMKVPEKKGCLYKKANGLLDP